MTYEIGKFYQVPCVLGTWESRRTYWPVLGSLHEDGEIIQFPWKHYHIDWRFVTDRLLGADMAYSFAFGLHRGQHVYAKPLMIGPRINTDGLGRPSLRRRKCHREHALPFDVKKVAWLPKLEKAHAACKLAGKVCPHRGYDLTHEPVDAQGFVTCPLHGLRWNAATGALAPRAA